MWRFFKKDVELPTLVALPKYTPEQARVLGKRYKERAQILKIKKLIEEINELIAQAVRAGEACLMFRGELGFADFIGVDEDMANLLVGHYKGLGWDVTIEIEERHHSNAITYKVYYLKFNLFE